MVRRKKTLMNPPMHYAMGKYTFRCGSSFKYLFMLMIKCTKKEIQKTGVNKAYFVLISFLRSKLLSLCTKLILYKMSAGLCPQTPRKILAEKIDKFEIYVLRCIMGSVRENRAYDLRRNQEVLINILDPVLDLESYP